MKIRYLTLSAFAALFIASCATNSSSVSIDSKAKSVLKVMSDKLAAAKTVSVEITRKSSPGFNPGIKIAESMSGEVVVVRPDKLVAQLKTSEGKRTIGFDGKNLTLVDYTAGTHAIVKAEGDIDATVQGIQRVYGLTLPAAELLVNHPGKVLMSQVRSAKHLGVENVEGVECDHLEFKQDGLAWDLWIASGDKLPRKIFLSYANGEGGAPLTMTATLKNWELDKTVPAGELKVTAPASSREIEMVSLTD